MLNVTMYKIGKVITIAKSATAEYSLKNRRRINIEIFDAKMWPRLQLKPSNVRGVTTFGAREIKTMYLKHVLNVEVLIGTLQERKVVNYRLVFNYKVPSFNGL